MATERQRLGTLFGWALLLLALAGCSFKTTIRVNPSACINPRSGSCSGSAEESRILDVRLYQLKQKVDPCKLDLDAFAAGKDLEQLKSALIETPRSDVLRWPFQVTASEPRTVGEWEVTKNTQYVLAVAIGRGKSANTSRLIPVRHWQSSWKLPTLHFKGYDICLDTPCDVNLEAECHP